MSPEALMGIGAGLSGLVLLGLAAAAAYPPAWAVLRRVWRPVSYVAIAAGAFLGAFVLHLLARRRPEPEPIRTPPDGVQRAEQAAQVQRAQAAQAAAESEARTERAVADDDPHVGWADLLAERDRLRTERGVRLPPRGGDR